MDPEYERYKEETLSDTSRGVPNPRASANVVDDAQNR